MKLEQAVEAIKLELGRAGVKTSVEVELSVILHQDSNGGVEIECAHARSRRSEHTHKISFQLTGKKKKTVKAEEESEDAKKPTKITPPDLPSKRQIRTWG